MTVFVFGPFGLNPSTRELRNRDVLVALPARAYACLALLLEHRDRALSRDELIERLWNGRGASDVQLAQLIVQCRRAVDDDGQAQRAIRTIAGFGYRWVEPVKLADVQAPPATRTPSAVLPAPVALLPTLEITTAAPSARASPNAIVSTSRPFARAIAGVLLAAFVIVAVAIAALSRPSLRSSAPSVTGERVLVTPLRVDDDDAGWLRLGGLDVVVERLRRNRVPVVASETSVALLQAIAPDDGLGASTPPMSRLREATGAAAVVALAAHRDGEEWVVTATLGRAQSPPLELEARAADAVVALRALADRISGSLGRPAAEPGVAAGAGAMAVTLQQARAALLANQPQRARDLLLADPALVGDEPLLRQQLADVDIRAGRYADARRALDELLASGKGDASFRAQLRNARGMVSVRGGRFVEAGNDFSVAIDLLGEQGDALTLGRAYQGRGVSRTSLQDYADALTDDAQARAAFERSGDVGSMARVDSNLGALEILRGHMAQAEAYLSRALSRFRDIGYVQERVNALQLNFVALRAQLKSAPATAAIDELWSLSPRIVSPSSQWSAGLYRVDWLLWHGRLAEAGALLDRLAASAQPAAAAEGERAHWLRAMWERSAGRPVAALAEIAGIPDAAQASADDDSVRADEGLLRSRLERELGHPADAPEQSADRRSIASSSTPRTPLRLLAQANRALVSGDAKVAEASFEAALTMADEQGVAATIVAVVADYVPHLLATGRGNDAIAVAGRVALWSDTDYDAAIVRLRVAQATGQTAAWNSALARVHALAGERTVPPALLVAPL